MLCDLRDKIKGIVAAFVVGLLIVPFALWGINSYFDGAASTLVAEGDGVEVSQDAFRNTFDQYKQSLPPSMWDNPVIKNQVLESLIADTLSARNARKRGYRVGDAALRAHIEGLSYFQSNGKFDSEVYKMTLRSRRINIKGYEEQLRGDLVRQQLESAFRDSGFYTQAELKQLLVLMTQTRDIEYVTIRPARFSGKIKPDESAIKAFYEANRDSYQHPEQVQIEYIEVSAASLAADYKPTEKELRALYEQGGAGLGTPERRRVSHILVESGADDNAARAKIDDLAARLNKGADFAALAREYSADPGSSAKGGDLGWLSTGVMVKPFEQAANQLTRKGQISDVVKTQFGYHLIKLTDFEAAKRKPFSSVKPELEKQLRSRKGEERFFGLSEKFYNLVYEHPDTLATAANELGLKIKKSDWFVRGGGQGITKRPEVAAAAFHPEVLDQGRNSETLELGDTHLLALRVIGHRKARPREIGEVREAIRSALVKKESGKQVEELAQAVRAALEKQPLASVAATKGLKLEKNMGVLRDKPGKLDGRVVDAVFSAARPTAGKFTTGRVDLGSAGTVIFVLTRVQEGQPEKADAEMRKKAERLLTARRQDEMYQAHLSGLREAASVKIYRDNL